MSLIQQRGRLRPETQQQREAAAVIGEADIAELRARVPELTATGKLLDEGGNVMQFPAKDARAMLGAIKRP